MILGSKPLSAQDTEIYTVCGYGIELRLQAAGGLVSKQGLSNRDAGSSPVVVALAATPPPALAFCEWWTCSPRLSQGILGVWGWGLGEHSC